jgi:hypothetical protein
MMFFPDRVLALREMRRVLVEDGRVVLMVWGRMEASPGQAAVAAAWTRHLGPDSAAGFQVQHALADPAEVRRLLDVAGFRDIQVEQATALTRFPTVEHFVRGYGALIGLQVTPAVGEALIHDVEEALSPYAGPDGVAYPMEAVIASAVK